MRYARAKLKIEERELAYRFYVTEALRTVAHQLTRGQAFTASFADLMQELEKKPAAQRSGDEIASDIIQRAQLHFEGSD